MDEVHYLADRFRGAVWEEVIIHLPESVTLVSLSATVSNAEEFADWLVTVRGETAVVVSEHRPVPLWQHMLVGKRMFDLFHDADAAQKHEVHPELLRYTRETARRLERRRPARGRPAAGGRRGTGAAAARRRRAAGPGGPAAGDHVHLQPGRLRRRRAAVPARRAAADRRRTSGPRSARVVRGAHRARSRARTCTCSATGSGSTAWSAASPPTTPGMLPAFKEVVEELFVRGLVKAVFATETLALGINMPARCVVLERLVKFNGEAHVDLTPGEYTQLTGRAGRRGIDVEGHAVVIWAPEVDPRHVAGLASTRTYPLRSSFRPSYNMAVNLVGSVGAAGAPASCWSRRSPSSRPTGRWSGWPGRCSATRRPSPTYGAEMRLPPRRLRRVLRDPACAIADRERALARQSAAQRRRAAAIESLERLRVGDVIRVPSGRRAGLAVVLDPGDGAASASRARWC